MKNSVTRRTFIAGLAGIGAACGTSSTPVTQQAAAPAAAPVAANHPLTVFFTGLVFFQHDKTASEMRVGLLPHNHETIIVARKADVDRPGTDLTGDQSQSWHPTDLDVINQSELTYWKATHVGFALTSTDPLVVRSPFGVFPLRALAMQAPQLSAANCQSLLTFTHGEFAGKRRPHSCGHDSADWSMVRNLSDSMPKMKDVKLVDTVQYTSQISAGSFTVDGTTVTLQPKAAKLWVLQLDTAGTKGKDPREIVHCQHYYDLIAGYDGEKYYPRRDSVPPSCKTQVDVDPIYCTPAEDSL